MAVPFLGKGGGPFCAHQKEAIPTLPHVWVACYAVDPVATGPSMVEAPFA